MSGPNKIVMRHSPLVQGEKSILSVMPGMPESTPLTGDQKMPAIKSLTIKPGYTAGNGRMLCFAPPLMTGFRGCPLALSSSKVSAKAKNGVRRNFAKRRAFGH
jgi:hypothetical protein